MIFPTTALRSTSDPEDALGRIDRAINDRHHRLSAGLAVSHQFDEVCGALVISQGHGKYLRMRHVVGAATPIPPSVRSGCLEIAQRKLRDSGQIAQLLSDLAEPQAAVVEQLKCQAGKYVDRVLAVAVCDPGIWDQDFDDRTSYSPFCDSTRLAELCGVTVIDAFPARDLAVAGRGNWLESLPHWIMFADRNSRIASELRMLVSIGEQCSAYVLPASDGLDSDVPHIKTGTTLGLGFLEQLVSRCFSQRHELRDVDRYFADGLQIDSLRQQWESALSQSVNGTGSSDSSHPIRFELPSEPRDVGFANEELMATLVEIGAAYLKTDNSNGFSNVIRTGIGWIVDQCVEDATILNSTVSSVADNCQAAQLIVSCPSAYEAGFINLFTQLLDGTNVITARQAGVDNADLPAAVAALLGLFHIDQMPGNVPWLTGASAQRILGRLTPGRPSNWRQLVRVMADFQPAPMKLKDAI